jgi:HlyD family secretion protein
MKKAIPIFIVLVSILSILLYMRLREQRLEAQRPSGGSATIEGTEVDVIARLPTRVARVLVKEGGKVKKDQTVVELDCREQEAMLAQAEASLRAAKAALQAARLSEKAGDQGVKSADAQVWMAHAGYKAAKAQKEALEVQKSMADRTQERLKKVHVVGAVSEQKLDQTVSQAAGLAEKLDALQAQAQAAQARTSAAVQGKNIARIKSEIAGAQTQGAGEQVKAAEAAVERARVAADECTLTAPIGGYVLEKNYEPGEVVLPGSRVITIVDVSQVTATFYLPNAELSAAKPGRKVEVKADAYPQKVFEGRISHVAAEAEFTPRNVQTREDRTRLVYAVEVTIPNPDELLRPGMPVEVTIPGTGREP